MKVTTDMVRSSYTVHDEDYDGKKVDEAGEEQDEDEEEEEEE